MFAAAEAANAAAQALKEQGFASDAITVVGPGTPGTRQNTRDTDSIAARIMAAYIPRAEARVYADGVSRGGTLVIVKAAWGFALKAQRVMAAFDPVETGVPEPHDPARAWDEKRPLSSAFGLKLLGGSAAPASDMFSLPLLSKSATPLSDALHLGLLASGTALLSKALSLPMVSRAGRSASEAIGLPAVSKGRLLSEAFGVPTRVDHIGIPKVVRNGRPISEALGLPTVSKRGGVLSEAMGVPTLTKHRRSLTEAIGIPTLVRTRSASA